jgi:hypothetical protein
VRVASQECEKKDLRVKGHRTPVAPYLTEYQKQVIFGTMLGDLSAERSQVTTGNTRLRFQASVKNQELKYNYYSIFKPYVKTAPKIPLRKFNKLTTSEHEVIGFSTLKYCF